MKVMTKESEDKLAAMARGIVGAINRNIQKSNEGVHVEYIQYYLNAVYREGLFEGLRAASSLPYEYELVFACPSEAKDTELDKRVAEGWEPFLLTAAGHGTGLLMMRRRKVVSDGEETLNTDSHQAPAL
jgi:hypothetical protein